MSSATGSCALLQRMDWTALHGKRLFITGATGFFGTWLLRALDELNRGDASALAALEQAAAHDPEPVVREHAAWAIERIRTRHHTA